MGIKREVNLVTLGLCPQVVQVISNVGALSLPLEKLAVDQIQNARKNRLIKGTWE